MMEIAKWNETFENADSRKRQRLGWLFIPTGCDSSGYLALVAQEGGFEAFGIFLAICQWSATQPKSLRGKLIRASGAALTEKDIAVRIRAEVCQVSAALKLLTSNDVRWIVLCDPEKSAANLPPICRSHPDFVQGEGEGEGEGEGFSTPEKNEFVAAATSKDKTYELSQSTESEILYEPEKIESQEQKVAAADPIISLEVFLEIADKINVARDFATALHSDLVAAGWKDSKGNRIVSPAIFLRKAWERDRVPANAAQNVTPGKREAWHIEADIRRINDHIARIQKDPASRNSALGVSETREQHRERLQPKWLDELAPMRDEFREKLPADWFEYQSRLTEQKTACGANEQALEAWESDEYQLGLLAEMFPKDVPTFERWVKDFAHDPWLDPTALTFEAQGDMRDGKEQVKRLQAELAGILKGVTANIER